MLRTAGKMFTHAANFFSTSARATFSASSGDAQVLRTTILSVIVFFSRFHWTFWQKRIINEYKDSHLYTMNTILRRAILLIIFALAGAYGFMTLRGPQGIPGLREKWREISKVEEDNANLQRENEYRRSRIKKLELSPAEQELEIRKTLKLLRPGETSFILPDQPKQDGSQSTPPPESK